jgi:hypothetical protein
LDKSLGTGNGPGGLVGYNERNIKAPAML